MGQAEQQTLATGETRYLATEVAGGFTGVYFALYATGNGNASKSPAFFDWFDYHMLD
jgi:xylan 1,4-beta-xylosidase